MDTYFYVYVLPRSSLMLHIRAMTTEDIGLGMRLKGQAGWNQTEGDWRRFLALEPTGCFVAEAMGTPVGTAVSLVFGSVAWVAMLLVEKRVRGQGIGTALMSHVLAYLDQRQVPTVRLDATPQGRPIYEKLGFVMQYELVRYEGVLSPAQTSTHLPIADPSYYDKLFSLDRQVTSTPRGRLLRALFDENPDSVLFIEKQGNAVGYVAARAGAETVQIGPCIASVQTGGLLLTDLAGRYARRRVVIDIPVGNGAATDWAASQGLTVQRSFFRMCRGAMVNDRVNNLFASSGPEKG